MKLFRFVSNKRGHPVKTLRLTWNDLVGTCRAYVQAKPKKILSLGHLRHWARTVQFEPVISNLGLIKMIFTRRNECSLSEASYSAKMGTGIWGFVY